MRHVDGGSGGRWRGSRVVVRESLQEVPLMSVVEQASGYVAINLMQVVQASAFGGEGVGMWVGWELVSQDSQRWVSMVECWQNCCVCKCTTPPVRTLPSLSPYVL